MRFIKQTLTIVMLLMVALNFAIIASANDKPDYDKPDYSKDVSWSMVNSAPLKTFDVFFVHPTSYFTTDLGLNAPVTDPQVNAATDAGVVADTDVFANNCNIYAPRYRQTSIEVLKMDKEKSEPYSAQAQSDIVEAFKYYLKHYNNGRPFFLASHSQGSFILLRVLLQNQDIIPYEQLVASYLIGWTFTDDDLKKMKLPLAVRPDQTGGVITWNTVGKGGKSPVLLEGANCINPLTWTNSTEDAPASLNIGSVFDIKDGSMIKVRQFTSAQINENGGLEIPTPAIIDNLNMGMGKGVYHHYDYGFFHDNFTQNVMVRCNAWLSKKK